MSSRADSRAATRRKVVGEARVLFEQKGYARTTVRDIAAGAGVSVGTVMSVGDKDELLVEAFEDRIREFHEERAAGAEDTQEGSGSLSGQVGQIGLGSGSASAVDRNAALEKLLATVGPFIDLFAEHQEMARAYGAVLLVGRHASQIFGELQELLIGEFEAVFARLLQCPPAQAEQLAVGAYLAYVGALFEWAATPGMDRAALRARLREGWQGFMGVMPGRCES
ncbi:TetR/AcrR family transcriptional regulator [Actinobaculum sp. 352]|uniref:TetR/AcrR family transcriptional regulator n=1 Tax=Actinobaculum sp. 352 TaxID=2490946 RepID=UPI000F7E9AAC|nr:TetR/AcrR family transcriptional regulator [Actinobaculum sp. 352]RTE49334.1 TetR/AcrR family transcriptional regulator [Actinobaculum sp. 352]